ADIVSDVEPAVVIDGRGVTRLEAIFLPHEGRMPVLVDLGAVQADDAALDVVVGAFLTVPDVDVVAVDHWRSIDGPSTEGIAPDLLARTRLHGVDAAVGAAGDHQALAADDRDHGHRVIAVLGRAARFGPPLHLAGVFIHGDKAAAALAHVAPARIIHADDDQVLIHHRTGEATAITRDAAILLRQRLRPLDLSILVEAEEHPLRAVGV